MSFLRKIEMIKRQHAYFFAIQHEQQHESQFFIIDEQLQQPQQLLTIKN